MPVKRGTKSSARRHLGLSSRSVTTRNQRASVGTANRSDESSEWEEDETPQNPPRASTKEHRPRENPTKRASSLKDSLGRADIPHFSKGDCAEWLRDVTFLFKLHDVTDPREKVTLLAPVLPTEIKSKIMFPLGPDCFKNLLKAIEEAYLPKQRERMGKLFQEGMKPKESPAQYLGRIKSDIGETIFQLLMEVTPEFIIELFTSKMPPSVRAILKFVEKTHTLDEMCEVAESMFTPYAQEGMGIPPSPMHPPAWVNYMVPPASPYSASPYEGVHRRIEEKSETDELKKLLSDLSLRITEQFKDFQNQMMSFNTKLQALEVEVVRSSSHHYNRGRSRTRNNRSQQRGRSSHPDEDEDICYHHRKFKQDSIRCKLPCKMSYLLQEVAKESAKKSSGN